MVLAASLPNALEDIQARLLAAEAGDNRHIDLVRTGLQQILCGLNPALPLAESVRLCLQALDGDHLLMQSGNVSALLGAVTSLVAAVVRHLETPDAESAAALEQAAGAVRGLLAGPPESAAGAGQGPSPSLPAALAAVLPADTDMDLLREFICESCDRLATAEVALLALEAKPADAEQINTVLRAFHTIKGAAGFLGLEPVQQLATSRRAC
jgi:hypothetical protein